MKNTKSPRVGSIVLATDQGLGYMAKDFYDNGIVHNVLVHKHGKRKNHYSWYPNRVKSEEELLDKSDILLFFETPFDWKIILRARERGIKTILMGMHECTRFPFTYEPDEIWCPSGIEMGLYADKNCKQITVPVKNEWKMRTKARTFVHNTGNGSMGDRNGTNVLLKAMKHVESPIKLIVRSQVPIRDVPKDARIDYRLGTFDDIWSEGDVFIFPERFNGLSLPLQEAYASGMMVMCGKRFPMTEWLPNEPMIPVSGYTRQILYSAPFDYAEYNPKEIAKAIDSWYNKDISKFSLMGKEWNEKNSWKTLKETYKKLLSL